MLGVVLDLLAGQRRPGRVLPGRVADHAGEIADQEDHLMAQLLELAHLVEQHRVAQVQIGRSRVEARLDAQRAAAREPLGHLLLDQQLVAAALDHCEAVLHMRAAAGGSG